LQFVLDNFNVYYKGLLNNDLYGILTSMEYGFSLSEKMFEKIGDKLNMTRIRTVPPHSIEFTNGTMGEITRITQMQEKGQIELIDNKDKLIVFTNAPRFDNPYGRSDLERCYTPYYAKKQIIKFWSMHLEKYASPLPVIKVPAELGEDRVDELIKIMESFRIRTVAAIPDDTEIEFLSASGASDEYDKAIERFNQMIGRGLLVPDLLGFGQTTKAGSFSLGQTQFKIFVSALDYIRGQLEDMMNEQVVKPLVDMNFGVQETYPLFSFNPFEDEKLKEMMEVFLLAIDKGMPVGEEDWNQLRRNIGFGEIDDTAEPIKQPEKEIPDKPEKDNPTKKEMPEPEEEDAKKKFSLEFAKKRRMSKYEKGSNVKQGDIELRESEDKTIERLARIFKDIRESLKDTVIRKNIVEDGNVEAVNKLRLGSGKKFLGQARIMLQRDFKDVYDASFKQAKQEIKKLQKDQNFARVSDLQVRSREAKKISEELINERAFQAVGNLNEDLLSKSKTALLNGIEQGSSTAEVIQELDDIFNPVIEGTSSEGLTSEPALLETIVRTNYTNIYNQARLSVAKSPDLGGFVEMLEYSAILDSRTTEICERLDGKIYKVDDPIWNRISPPNHFNCRSRLVYVTEFDVKDDDISPSKEPNINSLKELPGTKKFLGA